MGKGAKGRSSAPIFRRSRRIRRSFGADRASRLEASGAVSFTVTFEFGWGLCCPLTTTRWPSFNPDVTIV
jgi:hypothetical protein